MSNYVKGSFTGGFMKGEGVLHMVTYMHKGTCPAR